MPKKKAKAIREKKDLEPSANVPIDPLEVRVLLLEKEVAKLKASHEDDPADVIGEQQIPLYGSYEIYGEATFRPELQTTIPRHGRSP